MLKATNDIGRATQAPRDQHYSITTRQWRYIRYNTGQEELYDRAADPLERDNLAARADQEETLAAMRKRLDAALPPR